MGPPQAASKSVPAHLGPGVLSRHRQPRLSADGLVLRPWQGTDVEVVVEAYKDPLIQRWHARSMDERDAAAWLADWEARWRSDAGASWAVTGDGVVVGRCRIQGLDLQDGHAEVAYWCPKPVGRGLLGERFAPWWSGPSTKWGCIVWN